MGQYESCRILTTHDKLIDIESIKTMLKNEHRFSFSKFRKSKIYVLEEDSSYVEISLYSSVKAKDEIEFRNLDDLAKHIYNTAKNFGLLRMEELNDEQLLDMAEKLLTAVQPYQALRHPDKKFTPMPDEKWSREDISRNWNTRSILTYFCRNMDKSLTKYRNEAINEINDLRRKGWLQFEGPLNTLLLPELTELIRIAEKNKEEYRQKRAERGITIEAIIKLSELGFAPTADVFDYNSLSHEDAKLALQQAREKQQTYIENVNRIGARLRLCEGDLESEKEEKQD